MQAGFMGIGADSTTLRSVDLGLPVAPAPLLAPLTAAVAGCAGLRGRGHCLAIVALASGTVIFAILLACADLTLREAGIAGISGPGSGMAGRIDFGDRQVEYVLGLAGALHAHSQSYIEVFGVAQSPGSILAVIIGAPGTVAGPVIGSFFVVFPPAGPRFAESVRPILQGPILVLAISFRPRGILGVLASPRGWLTGDRA